MNLEIGKYLSYRLIYNFKIMELKFLRTYINFNLANYFIQYFKSFTLFYLSKCKIKTFAYILIFKA